MKLNALVVAAMVVTLVNAAGHGRFGGLFKQGSDITRSDSEASLLEKKEPPRRGVKQRSSRKSLGHRLRPVFPSKSTRHRPDTPHKSKPKANIICDFILSELRTLWDKVYALNNEFQEQLPRSYNIMMMEKGDDEKGKRVKKVKKEEKTEEEEKAEEEEKIYLKDKKIQRWLEVYSKAIPDLRNFKAKYDSLEKERNDILQRYDESECPETFTRLSLKEIAKQGHLPKWYDENGVNFLGEY
ncbi:hypothetical protein BASA83_000918 [Batrachochytrium salamandrivorans]|nr:hypothetical protein BASA81_014796 [Batrachochytrium salamandrivorans]KAH9276783.1 hypothetical protein BASA83_000918 [Batrachochytrium salamandrivorans]